METLAGSMIFSCETLVENAGLGGSKIMVGAAPLCSSKNEMISGRPSSATWKSSLRNPPTGRPLRWSQPHIALP